MTYFDSAEGIELTARQVARVIRQHGADPHGFWVDTGLNPSELTDAQRVLAWLGY